MEKNPLLDEVITTGFQGGPVLAQVYEKDIPTFDSYLNNPKVRQLLPSSKRFTKFCGEYLTQKLKLLIYMS